MRMRVLVVLVIGLTLAAASAASAVAETYTNPTPVTIPASGPASPYGTSIEVEKVPGLVSRVGVELLGAQHQFARDVRVLLVGPAGEGMVLNRQGGLDDLALGNLRIDTDSAATTFSDSTEPGAHAIEPDLDPGASMPAPAPAAPYGGSLRPLLGGSPNGTWTLYVADVTAPAEGSIAGGWRLHLDTTTTDRLKPTTSQTGVEGEDSVTVTLNRQQRRAALAAADLRIRSVDGTAKAGEDFVAVDRIVHFGSGQIQASIKVPLLGDDVTEGTESFGIEYADLPSGVAPPTDPSPPVVVVDDDGPAGLYADFDRPRVDLREGGGNPGIVTIVRTGSVTAPLTLSYGFLGGSGSGAASAGDLQLGSGIALPAARRVGVSLPSAVDDTEDEAPFEIGALIFRANGAFATGLPIRVLDNEGAAVASLAVQSEAEEGDAGSGQVTIRREAGLKANETGTVSIANGTAVLNSDYFMGGTRNRSLTNEDASVINLSLSVLDDAQSEGTEEVRVTLTSMSGSTIDPARAGVNLPLLDNENPTGYGGELAPDTYNPTVEGTVLRIPVERIGPAGTAVSARWSTRDGTAVAGRDYEPATGTVAWTAGDTATKEIQVVTRQDTLVEGDETVGIVLDAPESANPSAPVGLSPATVDGTITDDDTTGPGQLDVDAGALTVAEGQPIVVPVHRTLGTTGAVAVTCRDAGGSTRVAPATVTFADGETEGTCTIPTANDALDSPDATFTIELADPTGGAVLGPRASRAVTVTDDDEAGSGPLRLGAAEAGVAESAGTVPVTIDRGPGTTGEVSAQLSLVPGTAGAADATLSASRITIPAGQPSATATLAIVDDTEDEPDTEDLTLTLSDPQGGLSLGTPASERIVITDDDGAGTASFATTGALKVVEGKRAARLTVRRQFGLTGGAGFSWSVVPGTAKANDLTARSGRSVFAAEKDTAELVIPIRADTRVERNESFRVVLSDPVAGLGLAAPTTHAVTILDDDGFAPVRILTRRARVDARGRVGVRLACPRKARRRCAGRLSLGALGSARYSIKPRRRKTVRVKVGSAVPASVTATARASASVVRVVRRPIRLRGR